MLAKSMPPRKMTRKVTRYTGLRKACSLCWAAAAAAWAAALPLSALLLLPAVPLLLLLLPPALLLLLLPELGALLLLSLPLGVLLPDAARASNGCCSWGCRSGVLCWAVEVRRGCSNGAAALPLALAPAKPRDFAPGRRHDGRACSPNISMRC